ncbi:MAG: HEAT repeat domain-containing protein [Thermoguttaceae bacterium]
MGRTIGNLALVAALLLAYIRPLGAQTVPAGGKVQADKLSAVLRSDAPLKEKADACRGLAVIGAREAVPVLAGLLGDEQLSHMARYALEPIPDPAVDEALRAALERLKGRPLVGVIVSLGVRRDPRAVEPLARMLRHAEADVVQAAARSLGRIGTPQAARALLDSLEAAPAPSRPAFCEGLLRAAEALAAAGQAAQATTIYDRLRSLQPAPHQVRTAALRGAILTRGPEGIAILRDQLRSQEYLLFAAAVRTSQELRGPEVTAALVEALPAAAADGQILLLEALGARGDPAAIPAVSAAAKQADQPVRLAAVRAMAQIGHPSALGPLLGLAGDSDRQIAQAAQEGLAILPGREVDAALVELLAAGQIDQRLLGLELVAQRRPSGAFDMLLKAARDPEASIRAAAMKRLGELARPAEIPALAGLLMRAESPQDLNAAEQALVAACGRVEQPDACAETLIPMLKRAQAPQKAALVRGLGALGGARALNGVRTYLEDASPLVRATAVRTLAAWKTPDVLPDLLTLARDSKIPAEKALGLRGYVGWAARGELPAGQRVAICREGASLAATTEEKNLLLSALGSIPSLEAVALALPYLDDAATRDAACAAALSAAERVLKGQDASQVASKLIEPLKQVAEKAANAELARRAQAALKRAQAKAAGK